MIKKILLTLVASTCIMTYANAQNNDTDYYNNPTVNSFAASSQQFPSQNELTGEKGKKYNTSGPQKTNNPTVNSFMSSANQFPQQNQLTGKKGQKYNTSGEMKKKKNNPIVNSRMSSANMFPDENNFNNNGHSKKNSYSASGAM